MSRPTAISPEEQEQIARRIGVLLLRSATDDWQQIMVEYRATGDYHDLLGEVATSSGAREPWEPPEELVGVFEHLREGMYRPDVGTWLSALYVVERPSSYRIDINFDTEPQWNRPLPRAAYVDEFRRYPRADENIPDWVQAKLDGTGAANQAPADAGAPSAAPEPPATAAPAAMPPAPEEPAERDQAGFRRASVFDGYDQQNRPLVTARKPISQEEIAPLRHYLENAPIVVPSQDTDTDRLDPQKAATVATNWRTDGTWLWQDAVAFYFAQYGVPPQTEFVEHVRQHRFALPEVDDQTQESARRELLGDAVPAEEPHEAQQPELPEAPPVAEEAAFLADPVITEPEPADEPPSAVAEAASMDDERSITQDETDIEPEEAFTAAADSDDAVQVTAPPEEYGQTESVDEDAETVLSLLRKKLSGYGIDEGSVGIAEHTPQVRCLVRDGSDWLVSAGSEELPSGDVRFTRVDQAAAYLLGSVLLYRAAPERPSTPAAMEPPAAPAPVPEPAMPEPVPDEASADSRQSLEREPAQPDGHFLFTANHGQPPLETRVPPPHQDTSDGAGRREGGPERQAPAGNEPTQFQPVPRPPDRPAPPSPPAGQPAQPLPPGIQGPTPGQAPPPLPKRAPRMDQGSMGRPPERPGPPDRLAGPPQQGAGGLGPAGGAERRPGPGGPGPAGPPRQGPMGAPQRPPQGSPVDQGGRPPQGPTPVPQAPGGGREQIQPMQGEPPLTLFRDRRPAMLQPGTEVDRFGDPTGNVTYVARTPYSNRSLPPQWSGRPYFAYRVQRPLHALQGTAVPWFEQPGGGTAFVLPAAINDLLADGTLVELSGAEAPPRPPIE